MSRRCFHRVKWSHRRQGSGLDELCSGAGRRQETGSVPLKVGDRAGWAWWSGVGRRWVMRLARQLGSWDPLGIALQGVRAGADTLNHSFWCAAWRFWEGSW